MSRKPFLSLLGQSVWEKMASFFSISNKKHAVKIPYVSMESPSKSITDDLIAKGIVRGLIGISLVVLVGYFVWEIRKVFFYIVFAMVLALIGRPIVRFFHVRLKMPTTLSVMLTMLFFISIAIGLIGMIIPMIIDQAGKLSLLNTPQLRENVSKQYALFDTWLNSHGIHLFPDLDKTDFFSNLDYEILTQYLDTFVTTIGSFFIDAFSILFLTFFFMKDRRSFTRLALSLCPAEKKEQYTYTWLQIKELLSRYFWGITLQLTIIFVLYMAILLSFGINNALIIAFLCALLNAVPYLGPLIGGGIFCLLSMTSLMQGRTDFQEIIPTMLRLLLWYIGAQGVDNFLSQPIIYSKSVSSHPVEIFLAILIGGILFGVLGMILAVPVYTVLRVILREFFSEHIWVRQWIK